MKHILTDKADILITNMLYAEVRQILMDYYFNDGKYNAKFLASTISNLHERDKVRNWLKKETPDWLFKNRDIKNNSRVWALRHELEYLQQFTMYNFLLKDWMEYNIHNVFKDSAYINETKTYKDERDGDLMFYRSSLK